ncbi:MAG: hypothetical protein K9J18_03780 [Crocinitomicaceae bacterium]|nr:hypothetical protein [Crocinitomicaceae bacterium]
MRTKRLIYFVFTVLLLGQNQSALAQSQSSLEKRAAQAFAQQNYSAALVDYRQLLAKDQQNPNFNYHYGVCLFEVDNHFEAAKYFDVALGLKQISDPLLYYYRAQIFQEQYFFAQAIKAYENYQQLSQQAKTPRDVSRQIAECQRGLKEVSAFIRLPLLSLQTTKNPKFYSAYPFAPDDYTFYEAPEVHSKNNAKHAHVPVYAYKRGMKYRILASYGPKGTQLDLYIQKKDANNNWGSPQLIGGGVNDPLSNESFGFYDAASQTLYFSSTAQSIGAHDLFKASFELTTNTASAIEKMPYPYASPSDDLFYVCDAAQNQAYFATSRQGVVGQYEIYTLQLDAPVRSNFVFAGFFTNELQPESKALSLQFTDLLTSEVYGPFVSDATGAYQVALPQKGDFLLEIQVDGASKVYQTRFSIPNLQPQTILQQQVLYFSDELGKEQWQVRNQLLEQDPATQLAGFSKLQMNVAKGGLLQAKTSALESSKPLQVSLAATFGFAAQDTAAFVTQMIDTLLAAEVSLENQVRLMELLRQDFEQQLDVREQLLAKLSQAITQPSSASEREELLQELAAVESALAFNQRWIQINQAANIPDLVLLDTLRALNERHQALLLSGDSLGLLAGWTQQQAALQQYLEIAAFDGASALEAAALEQKRSLQKLIQEEAAIKAQQQQVAQQIKQLQTALPLQSKKEQAQTQLQIAARERESKALDATATQLRSEREAAAAELQVFDQSSRKAAYLKAAENQSLPQINLQSSYDELLAQYAQQQDLSQNLKSQLATTENENVSTVTNPISSENGNVSTTTPENGNLGSNQELGNSEIINSNRTSTENGNTTSTNPISSENGNLSTTTNPISSENGNVSTITNPISSENGNVSTTTPENGNLGSNQELGNSEIINSNRTSTENGNTTSTNPISSENGNLSTTTNPISSENGSVSTATNPNSSENGNVSTTTPENGNLGSNQELGNSEIINSNRSSTEIGNTTATNPISSENGNLSTTTNPNSSENGNVSTTTPENGNINSINPNSSENGNISTTTSDNGNLGLNQELGNSEIINSNRSSTENRNTTSTNPELIQEQISRFEQELLAISMMGGDEIPKTLPKIERLGLSNEALESLEQQLVLPVIDATEQGVDVEAYVNYAEQRRVFEQTKIELLRNQQELRAIEEDFRAEKKEQLAALILAQVQLQERLNAQQRALVALPNQAVYEALLQQNYRPQVSAQGELAQGVGSAAVAGSVFAVQEKQAQTQATPLPVGLPCPQGLVFRVQVGAFRKPVPAERFREFTPVDGQVLANGLTVYMAGYFSSSAEALQQQKLIRTLGYPDAFVVAYQNCSRLSLAQGRALETSTTSRPQELASSSLFASPGQGLYYTVQVGVYNRPLTSEAQIGLSELIEAKTAKGQYRYASGKFGNLKDAKARQQLAVAKGITDAFIVAYYQGKRIDLAQARLLAQSGIAFEQNFEQNQVPALSAELQQKLLALELPQTQPLKIPDPVLRYETKCTDCQAELSRYNRVGVFVYDPEKDLIMSAMQKASEWDVVQLMYMKELRKKTPTLKGETQTLELDLNGLDGAFVDWLLRQANSYELSKDQQGNLQLRFVLPSVD